MKRVIKNNLLGFILGAIIFGSIGVYAATQYAASQITYNKNGQATVEAALNDLYSKQNKTATQVATLTTQGATYTMQNDGYVVGNVRANGVNSSNINVNSTVRFKIHFDDTETINASVFAQKDSVVSTGAYGTYNLTVYEWK